MPSSHQGVVAAGDEVGLLEAEDGLSGEEDADGLCLLAGPAEQTPVPQRLGPSGVLVHVVVHVLGQPVIKEGLNSAENVNSLTR